MIPSMETSVLLLNASYEPICVVSFKRAVVLVLLEKAEVVSSYEDRVVHSATREMPMPSVIRLVRYVNIPHFRKAYLSRRTVLKRDGGLCAYCGKAASTMDHIVPRSRGGLHSWENVVACCYPCNQTKDDRLLDEIGWKLRLVPTRPEGTRRLMLLIGDLEPAWEEWLPVAG